MRSEEKASRVASWQEGMALVNEIYRVTSAFPREESFGLTKRFSRDLGQV